MKSVVQYMGLPFYLYNAYFKIEYSFLFEFPSVFYITYTYIYIYVFLFLILYNFYLNISVYDILPTWLFTRAWPIPQRSATPKIYICVGLRLRVLTYMGWVDAALHLPAPLSGISSK